MLYSIKYSTQQAKSRHVSAYPYPTPLSSFIQGTKKAVNIKLYSLLNGKVEIINYLAIFFNLEKNVSQSPIKESSQ